MQRGERVRVREHNHGGRAAAVGALYADDLDGVGVSEQTGDQVEVGVHHVQCQGVQAEVVTRPEQGGAAFDLQDLQRPVALVDHRFA